MAPVWPFGWTLLTLGACQVDPQRAHWRIAYVAVLLLMLTYDRVPTTGVAKSLLGR